VIAFRRVEELRTPDDQRIPGFLLEPENVIGGATVIHGHGHSKDETLGFLARLTEAGIAALAIDLRGHGEHPGLLDERVAEDVDAAVDFTRRYGPTAAVGHSLGGRLALMSKADLVVAISPAIPKQVSPSAKVLFEQLPNPSVREPYPGYVLDLLKHLGPPPVRDRPTLLVSARYDTQAIREGTRDFARLLPRGEYREVEEELRLPVDLGHPLLDYLPYWLNHRQMPLNRQVLRMVPEWLRERLTERH
jgi:Alpha/beta hydrolase family